jgi:hypothetical protein
MEAAGRLLGTAQKVVVAKAIPHRDDKLMTSNSRQAERPGRQATEVPGQKGCRRSDLYSTPTAAVFRTELDLAR